MSLNEAIGKKIDSRRIFDLAESYLGKRITHYFVLGARLDCAGGNKGSGGGWHRDSAFSHQFKAIIYLTDTDANSGPFQYLRGSHTSISKIKFFGFGETQSKTRYSDSEMVDLLKYCEEFNAPKGTAIFADTRGVHRGKPIFLGRRYALTYYLWTKSPPSDFGELLQREPSLVV